MKIFKTAVALCLMLILLLSCVSVAFAEAEKETATVLFTHDLHSRLLPSRAEDGTYYGGYARLMTAIKEQKAEHPEALLVDGGDFSMGSLFQTAFKTSAIELRMMGKMGYDVTTFGNHEFDYLPEGLASMLNSAVAGKENLPQLVEANYLPPKDGEEGYNPEISAAFENYGVKEYTILEKDGVYYLVFGVFGEDSDACAPNSGMILSDIAQVSQKIVDEGTKECKEKFGKEPVVVCLSHSGTSDGEGEDYELAKSVQGIDLIVSGHTHTTLEKPIEVNGTYVVSAGEYGRNLGVATFAFDNGEAELTEYKLIPIDESVQADAEIEKTVENFKKTVDEDYLSAYGVSFDEVVTENPYDFDTVDMVYATQHESTLGNVFSDAYKWAAEKVTGEKVDMALTAAGVIRDTLPKGDVTVSDVFNAASLGVGTEGELVSLYITGADLKNALEVDASVQPIMRSAQLFCSGVEYSFNTNRMIFNKVDKANLRNADGTLSEIEDDKLYRVVTGMYVGQMLGEVKSKSYGLLSITPRDKNGNPVDTEKLADYVIKDSEGNPLKEWNAITMYLQSMNGVLDVKYAQPDGRKVVYASLNPVDMLSNANVFTYVAIAVILLLVAVVVLVTVLVVKKIKKRKQNK